MWATKSIHEGVYLNPHLEVLFPPNAHSGMCLFPPTLEHSRVSWWDVKAAAVLRAPVLAQDVSVPVEGASLRLNESLPPWCRVRYQQSRQSQREVHLRIHLGRKGRSSAAWICDVSCSRYWSVKGGDLSSVTSNPSWGPFYLSSTCSFAYRDAKPGLQEKKWLFWVRWIENADQTKTTVPTFWFNPKNLKIQTTKTYADTWADRLTCLNWKWMRLPEPELPWAFCFLKVPKIGWIWQSVPQNKQQCGNSLLCHETGSVCVNSSVIAICMSSTW